MTSAPPKRRGRPRAYEPDIALGRARDTFWRKGFAATSLDDLAAGMGMNRPSIYAAFGDKRALYLRAVTEYSRASVAALDQALTERRSLRDGLRAVYQDAAAFYQAGAQAPRGCFLIGTAVTEANGDRRLRAILDATFEAFTAAFTKRFERAARDGQLAPLPPAALGHIATAALNNVALRARTGASVTAIDALIDATIDAICGPER
jgi:TetR/AcrR family transcriptional regulator, copper-responsive repressor